MNAPAKVADADWMVRLREECLNSSQNRVSKRLGLSGATISQVLAGKYPGRLDRVEMAVRGVFMDGKVGCPALGEIKSDVCVQHQHRAKSFATTNSSRVRMYRACRACARFTKDEVEE